MSRSRKSAPLTEQMERDISSTREKAKFKTTDKKYKLLLETVEHLESERDAIKQIQEFSTHDIVSHSSSGMGEATAVVLASDWHVEERVRLSDCNGMNQFTLDIAKQRSDQFWKVTKRLVEVFSKDLSIRTLIVALLGDFISNGLHEELVETAQLQPVEAIIFAQDLIASGIKFLLKNTKLDLVIPCHSGNHGRTVKKPRNATEKGNSLEYFMYHSLANQFSDEARIKWIISPSYHSFLDVYGFKIRFHHGHNIRYYGGIGDLFIPGFKAVAQWNKAKTVDLDCWGHFHSMKDGGSFLCNGSLIGFNAYAVSIKAGFERPKQTFFLVDKKRGRTAVCPILFDK